MEQNKFQHCDFHLQKPVSNKDTSSVRCFPGAGWWHTLLIPPPYTGMRWKPFILVIQKSGEKNCYIMRTSSPLTPLFTLTKWQKRGERKDVFENGDKRVSVSLTHLPKGVIREHNSILLLILWLCPSARNLYPPLVLQQLFEKMAAVLIIQATWGMKCLLPQRIKMHSLDQNKCHLNPLLDRPKTNFHYFGQ